MGAGRLIRHDPEVPGEVAAYRRAMRFRRVSLRGFSLVEVMIVVAILGVLSGISSVLYKGYISDARNKTAMADIQALQLAISVRGSDPQDLPTSLLEIGADRKLDPWGHPYRYQRLDLVPRGSWRKDKNLVPLNATYDLWSDGADGTSQAPLTAKASEDDIIRANDGTFVGLAKDY